jgi:hypothetical protein
VCVEDTGRATWMEGKFAHSTLRWECGANAPDNHNHDTCSRAYNSAFLTHESHLCRTGSESALLDNALKEDCLTASCLRASRLPVAIALMLLGWRPLMYSFTRPFIIQHMIMMLAKTDLTKGTMDQHNGFATNSRQECPMIDDGRLDAGKSTRVYISTLGHSLRITR